jgi:hypothetical protein
MTRRGDVKVSLSQKVGQFVFFDAIKVVKNLFAGITVYNQIINVRQIRKIVRGLMIRCNRELVGIRSPEIIANNKQIQNQQNHGGKV